MFSRNNRLDYQVFFHTRGAVRSLGRKGLVIIVSLSNVLNYLFVILTKHLNASPEFRDPRRRYVVALKLRNLNFGMLILTALLGRLLVPEALKLLNIPLRRSMSLCSPLVAILLLAPSIQSSSEGTFRSTMTNKTMWTVFIVLFLAVLLLTISRLRFRRIIQFVDRPLGRKQVFWRRLIVNLCMLIALAMVVFMHDDREYSILMLRYEIYAIVVVSFGNLQIPAAALRVVLALMRLGEDGDDSSGDKTNLAASLNIFYGLVLGQGILYLVACTLDIFTFIPRRSLARHGGFKGQLGMESINLYHGYVLGKCMERDALAPIRSASAALPWIPWTQTHPECSSMGSG